MNCISISFKTAPESIRKHFVEIDCSKMSHCVFLKTCNRAEIYTENIAMDNLELFLSEYSGITVSELRKYARYYSDKSAIKHLFKVACGLESMVIGENEILGQVRDCYCYAYELGNTGYELDTVFRAAIACAKKTKNCTDISKSGISIATIACHKVADFIKNNHSDNILLIGASGKIGSSILKNLLNNGFSNIVATKRVHGVIEKFLYADNIKEVDYSNRYDWLNWSDVVISATESPHYTINFADFSKNCSLDKKRLFLDLAMPADIDVEISNKYGYEIISIDDFSKIASENNMKKENSIKAVTEIIEDELEDVYKKMSFHNVGFDLSSWKESFKDYSFEEILFLLRDKLDSKSLENVLGVLKKELDK